MSLMSDFFYFNRNKIIILVLISLLGVGSYFAFNYYQDMLSESKEIEEEIISSDTKDKELEESKKKDNLDKEKKEIDRKILYVVDIKGKVKNPGVYELESDKRVIDVINKAGGITKDGDTSLINLSKKISDGMVIIVYSKEQVKNLEKLKEIKEEEKKLCNENIVNDACISNDEEKDKMFNGKISLNNASLEELQTLTGIGESKALKIIEYRKKKKFTKIEEIMEVEGIGESIFAKIKENLTL